MNKIAEEFAARVAELGLTQRALAARLGMTEAALNRKLHGRAPVRTIDLLALCQLQRVDEDPHRGSQPKS